MLDAISSEGEQEVLGLRAEILGGLGFVDGQINEALAGYLARDTYCEDVLSGTLLPGVALEQRCKALISILDTRGDSDDYPFIVLLPPVIFHRNILAHMALDIFESTDELLVFTGYRRGEWQTKQVRLEDLRRAEATIRHASIDLGLLWQRTEKNRYLELIEEARRFAQPETQDVNLPAETEQTGSEQLRRYRPFPARE